MVGQMGYVAVTSRLGAVLLEEIDETVGGGVVGAHVAGCAELGLDLLGKLFAQLHSVATWRRSGSQIRTCTITD